MSVYQYNLSPEARARTLALSYANPKSEPNLFNFIYETLLCAFRNEPARVQTMKEVRRGIIQEREMRMLSYQQNL